MRWNSSVRPSRYASPTAASGASSSARGPGGVGRGEVPIPARSAARERAAVSARRAERRRPHHAAEYQDRGHVELDQLARSQRSVEAERKRQPLEVLNAVEPEQVVSQRPRRDDHERRKAHGGHEQAGHRDAQPFPRWHGQHRAERGRNPDLDPEQRRESGEPTSEGRTSLGEQDRGEREPDRRRVRSGAGGESHRAGHRQPGEQRDRLPGPLIREPEREQRDDRVRHDPEHPPGEQRRAEHELQHREHEWLPRRVVRPEVAIRPLPVCDPRPRLQHQPLVVGPDPAEDRDRRQRPAEHEQHGREQPVRRRVAGGPRAQGRRRRECGGEKRPLALATRARPRARRVHRRLAPRIGRDGMASSIEATAPRATARRSRSIAPSSGRAAHAPVSCAFSFPSRSACQAQPSWR